MNRIENAMAALKEKGEKAFITYMTAGLPDMEKTKEIIKVQGEYCSRITLCYQDALCVKRSVQGGYRGHRKPVLCQGYIHPGRAVPGHNRQ